MISVLRGCGSPLSRCTNSAIGTPQVRWREIVQSGRPSIMPAMRASPQAGYHFTPLIASSASRRRLACSIEMNHCGVARNATGVLCRQQCRSEEHTSELQSLMRSSYAGFCYKKKKIKKQNKYTITYTTTKTKWTK